MGHGAWSMELVRYFTFVPLFFACKNDSVSTIQLTSQQVDSIANIGFQEYTKNPLGALPYFINAANAYQFLDSFNKSGNVFLNVAGIYEEHTLHIDSAMIFAGHSLNNYRKGSDSMQIANLYKYYGYLVGIDGNIPTGINIIDTAIGIYTRHEFQQGVAVSRYNLARLAFIQKEYQKVDSLLDLAAKVWIQERDAFRYFLINQLRLEVGIATSNSLLIDHAIQQNDSILMESELSDALIANYQKLKEKSSIITGQH